ncbi:MAG: sugar phosphate isomerase/epimerase [Oscillospiraceae bacterium]|nr:sugar phosphate isomerase/epimerase [Oscillospiraceae bacterium]
MKIGIDSYCYHRFFGEVYNFERSKQKPPEKNMTMDDFLERAKQLGVDGVSLESCFFPSFDDGYFRELKSKLDDYGFDRVYAWGHPDGLERGQNPQAYEGVEDSLIASIPRAKLMGAEVMRVVGSSLMFRHEPHGPQIEALAKQFKSAMEVANDYGIKLAIENHIDYTADEILQLLEMVDNKDFGVNFDTGNFLRLLDDPIVGMEKLAPYVFATHIKDLLPNPDARPDDWFFFSGVPVGWGLIDNKQLAAILKKHNYQGFLAVEIDNPHPDWFGCEDEAVGISVKNLRTIAEELA